MSCCCSEVDSKKEVVTNIDKSTKAPGIGEFEEPQDEAPPPKTSEATPEPETFTVEIEKNESSQNKIGLDITHYKGVSLNVQMVKDGLMKDWNSKQDSNATKVEIGCIIVEVNGVSGNSADLLRTIAYNNKLTLKIVRPE
mmetsp:Transcript_30685/g.69772  ORF Transcript_30685/g.69772 Transcript_30685/m.69772 type:complete len:140 (+) Transcript_30685:96-515(+)